MMYEEDYENDYPCGTCKFHVHDYYGDWVCENKKSEHCGGDTCDFWEERL